MVRRIGRTIDPPRTTRNHLKVLTKGDFMGGAELQLEQVETVGLLPMPYEVLEMLIKK